MPVSEEAHSRLGRDVERKDHAGETGREGDHARLPLRRVFAHEDRAAPEGALEHAPDAASTAHLGRGLHDDRLRHPGELSRLGEDRLARVEGDLEHGHGGADDPVLYQIVLPAAGFVRSLSGRSAMGSTHEKTNGGTRGGYAVAAREPEGDADCDGMWAATMRRSTPAKTTSPGPNR